MQDDRAIYLVAWQTEVGYLRAKLLRGRQGITFKDARVDKLGKLVELLDVKWPVVEDPKATVYSDAVPGEGRMVIMASENGGGRHLTIGYTVRRAP